MSFLYSDLAFGSPYSVCSAYAISHRGKHPTITSCEPSLTDLLIQQAAKESLLGIPGLHRLIKRRSTLALITSGISRPRLYVLLAMRRRLAGTDHLRPFRHRRAHHYPLARMTQMSRPSALSEVSGLSSIYGRVRLWRRPTGPCKLEQP